MERIVLFLSVPIMLLNFGSGLVGGIWLGILGEWRLLGIGFLLMITAHWGISLLLLPGLAFSGLAMACLNRNNMFGMKCFGFLSQFYTNALILASCAFAFYVCTRAHQRIDLSLLPYLLWSWGMALGPWQYLFSKEQDNEYSAISLMCASVFYMLFLIAFFVGPLASGLVLLAFIIVQLFILPLFNMYIASRSLRLETM